MANLQGSIFFVSFGLNYRLIINDLSFFFSQYKARNQLQQNQIQELLNSFCTIQPVKGEIFSKFWINFT